MNVPVHRNYMICRLRKIIGQYPKDAAPIFRSTEQSFIVTLKNLHYGKASMPSGIDHNVDKILSVISIDLKATQKQISDTLGMSV